MLKKRSYRMFNKQCFNLTLMSKEEKAKCTLSDSDLIDKSNEWVSKLAKSFGEAWVLRIPVDFNQDPDMLFIELGKRLSERNSQLTACKEVLREAIPYIEDAIKLYKSNGVHQEFISEDREFLTKAKNPNRL